LSDRALQRKLDEAIELHRKKDLARAEKLYRQVLKRDESHRGAEHLLGALLLEAGRNAEAAKHLREALRRRPEDTVLLSNLGEAQRRLGDYPAALATLRHANRLQPPLAEPHHTEGLVLQAMGRLEEAVAAYRRAVALNPGLRPTLRCLAEALSDLAKPDEAITVWRQVLHLHEECAEAHDGLGAALLQCGRVKEAIASFRQALACDAARHTAHSHLVYSLGLDPESDAPSILAEARRWSAQHAAGFAMQRAPHDNDRDPDRRLRVGYLSPDFRNHSHALFLTPLFQHHDRRAVEVFAYSLVRRRDAFTERIHSLADQFRDVSTLGDGAIARVIREDRIDVLVDVTMHLFDNRLLALARKPAPVQVAWLAYPGTTGLETMDYRLTDPYLDPTDTDAATAYTERSLRLPDTFWCYDPMVDGVEPGELPALRERHVTFGCLNNVNRTNPAVFVLWGRVLRAVAGSRILILAPPGETRTRIRTAFAENGVNPERVEFVEYVPRSDYFRIFHRVDIGLDTFPHNGGTTSLDSFWMGVPVVTLVGHTAVGRAGLCFASNLGLCELVATTPDEFVRAARELCEDLPGLARLRGELRRRTQASALMDIPRFARNLEAAFRTMWRGWCVQPP
jgi:protein O-GlcNAc transferase